MSELHQFDEDNFDSEVLGSTIPVLVEFGSVWYAPCKNMQPVLEQFASENENIKVGIVNIDKNEQLKETYSTKLIIIDTTEMNAKIDRKNKRMVHNTQKDNFDNPRLKYFIDHDTDTTKDDINDYIEYLQTISKTKPEEINRAYGNIINMPFFNDENNKKCTSSYFNTVKKSTGYTTISIPILLKSKIGETHSLIVKGKDGYPVKFSYSQIIF